MSNTNELSRSAAEGMHSDGPAHDRVGPEKSTAHVLGMTFPLLAVAIFWAIYVGLGLLGLHMFFLFLGRLALILLLGSAMGTWWFWKSGFSWKTKLGIFGFFLLCGTLATVVLHPSVLFPVVYVWSISATLTLGTLWLFVARKWKITQPELGLLGVITLSWIPGPLVRAEGLHGDGSNDIYWRWSRTAEDRFLEQLKSTESAGSTPPEAIAEETPPIIAQPGDWLGFRGPTGDSRVTGLKIGTDWRKSPPKILWKHAIGPAWSSMILVGDRLYTQEQRGDVEVVSCYSALTGEPIWAHDEPGRFDEALSGIGPRATPAFADGNIYAFGAKGRFDCLDATSGKLIWSRDAVTDAKATVPVWGFSSSPVIVDGLAIIYVGGAAEHALVAYQAATGEIAWKANIGKGDSYASPVVTTLHGKNQVLFLGDNKLGSYDLQTGELLWEFANPAAMGRPAVQPQLVEGNNLLLSFAPGNLLKISIANDGGKFSAKEVWTSTDIKPDFSDYVVHQDQIYGFDAEIFCSAKLESGERNWKGGRYGAGQAVLLSDQGVLLVLSEKGELVLVNCNPEKLEPLGILPVIRGKTWNHPAVQGNRIYVRNAEEIACVELPTE